MTERPRLDPILQDRLEETETLLQALYGGEVDAVVSDINMPGMTGIDLLRHIRRRDIDVPVILMTAAPRVDSDRPSSSAASVP